MPVLPTPGSTSKQQERLSYRPGLRPRVFAEEVARWIPRPPEPLPPLAAIKNIQPVGIADQDPSRQRTAEVGGLAAGVPAARQDRDHGDADEDQRHRADPNHH